MIKEKELLYYVFILIMIMILFLLGVDILAILLLKQGVILGIIIASSLILFIISCLIALKIEVEIGYYECSKCHHKFKTTYLKALLAMHIGTTRYLKCPKCQKNNWSKKVFEK